MNKRLLLPVLLTFLLSACQRRNGYGPATGTCHEKTVAERVLVPGMTVSGNPRAACIASLAIYR